ncbi:hypothetical protein DFH08DRAFT_925637 [Mycena albidolilacea]|uniref:Uncharacterized protein n=1 Tax=Mycena albidolilacea TaxID=1033008 RepID=A0AAD7ELS5_9AGAR|nr:hypothetical protein DFH08DRAFT_925637 [Mycena albidolilacea]
MHNNSQDHSLQWTHYNNSHAIKVESSTEPFSLLSPPTSPSLSLTSSSSLSCRRRSSGSINSPKRVRPYPPLPRDTRSRIDDSEMATTPAYWASSSNSRGGSSRAANNDRRASEGNQQLMYNSPYVSMPMYSRPSDASDEHRLSPSSGSSGTSSLTGAMGDAHVSSRHSGSPPPARDPLFNMTMGQPLEWTQAQMLPSQQAYPGGMPGPYMDPSNAAYYRNSPESLSPPTPFTTPSFNDPFRPGSAANYAPTQTPAYPPANPQDLEIRRLRKMLRELEQKYERAREQVKTLESRPAAPHRAHSSGGIPPPLSTPPATANFQASWKARTDARVRQFCALNRAGNALCAWHDSRRERRVYPPRMAPNGYLNCGCTYEEALFEESLSRHHVGSYLPGETVRMDPALRNPLLKLLQQRYGYKDGDFERDPRTGDWIPGEGPTPWEQQIQAGAPRRDRR